MEWTRDTFTVTDDPRISSPLTTYPFGERQYSAQDPFGHRWTFSQSVADVDPRDWGGSLATSDDAS